MTTISIYDHLTGETIVRDMTEEEAAEYAAQSAIAQNEKVQRETAKTVQAEAKTSAMSKLTALGLTEDEAKAIVGLEEEAEAIVR